MTEDLKLLVCPFGPIRELSELANLKSLPCPYMTSFETKFLSKLSLVFTIRIFGLFRPIKTTYLDHKKLSSRDVPNEFEKAVKIIP